MALSIEHLGSARPVQLSDGGHKSAFAMKCSRCSEELLLPLHASNGKRMPVEFYVQKAREQGWVVGKRGKHICKECKMAETKTGQAAPAQPREMQPADKRRVFRALDETYDEANSRYMEGHTDKTAAESLGVPRKWVETVREEAFGPSGHNLNMERVETALGKLETETQVAIKAAIKTTASAEEKLGEIRELRKQVEAVRRSVDPRR